MIYTSISGQSLKIKIEIVSSNCHVSVFLSSRISSLISKINIDEASHHHRKLQDSHVWSPLNSTYDYIIKAYPPSVRHRHISSTSYLNQPSHSTTRPLIYVIQVLSERTPSSTIYARQLRFVPPTLEVSLTLFKHISSWDAVSPLSSDTCNSPARSDNVHDLFISPCAIAMLIVSIEKH